MTSVVMIHGIAQEKRSAASLRDEWLDHAAVGLHAAGRGDLATRLSSEGGDAIESRMVFYGDLFDDEVQGFDSFDETQVEFARAVAASWTARAAASAGSRSPNPVEESEVEAFAADLSSLSPRSIARSVVAAAASVPWVAEAGFAIAQRFMESALQQVTAYFTLERLRAEIVDRAVGRVDDRTSAILGHSLGSVVAYEAAHRIDTNLPHLLTAGSPLGLRTVVHERVEPQPPSFPRTVRHWLNIANVHDVVAAEPDLRPDFVRGMPDESTFEGGIMVERNHHPHGIGSYLRSPITAKRLIQALES